MKKIFISLSFIVVICATAIYLAGTYFTKAVPVTIGKAPNELAAQDVIFENIHGWYHASEASTCVLLLHGVRANRTSMIKRANFLKDLGYSVLLIDLQAHGETPGDYITFGYRESQDVKAAVRFLRQTQHCTKVAAIGVSLGGASTLLGEQPAALDALVLESVFPRIEDAVYDRLSARLGDFLAGIIAPFLYQQIPLRFHIQLNQLHPIDAIKQLNAPVFIISGTADKHTTTTETQNLFNAAPEPKLLWLIEGAAHEDLYNVAGKLYENKIQNFLTLYLAD